MKLTDYMVGDWILSEHDFPMQVTAVGKDYIYADFEGNEGDVFEFDEKCMPKPIPLTTEFLEKNGLISDSDLCYWGYRYDVPDADGPLRVYKNFKQDDGITIHVGSVFRCYANIRFVHQLQHVFRLCGLEELANNLKI